MTPPLDAGSGSRLAAALRLSLEFRASGREDVAAFLAEHEGMRDLLAGMLSASGEEIDVRDRTTGDAGAIDGDRPPLRSFGDYTIEREVGRGGMGVVYAATQRALGRRVALKVLSAPLLHHERSLWRFRRESRLLAQLDHKGIVRVIDAGAVEGVPFYAMEFVVGAPLSAVVQAVRRHGLASANGATIAAAVAGVAAAQAESDRAAGSTPASGSEPAPRATIESGTGQTGTGISGSTSTATSRSLPSYLAAMVDICAQVAEALAFAHAAGVIHRDVKPSNVLLRRDGTAVLSDFGVARREGGPALTVTGDFAGTPYYVAPEQARGAAIDHRADVFSLGVMLYELVTLERPFEGGDTSTVLAKIQRDEPRDPRRLNSAVSADLAAVVLKALAKDPAHRHQGAGALAEDLHALLAGRPVSARPPTRAQRAWRWCRREPWKAAALGTAAVSIIALAAVTIGFTQRLLGEVASTRAALALAEQNFGKAREAVDEMLTRVGQRDLDSVPQMEPVRKKLLQRALAFYTDFAAARSGDVEVAQQLALARGRVAWIRNALGEERAAIDTAVAAIAEFDALLADAPDHTELRLERADAQLVLGAARERLGDAEAAKAVLVEAIGDLERLRLVDAAERRRRRLLANALQGLAWIERRRETARAHELARRSLVESEWLRQETPDDPDVAWRLANLRYLLGGIEHERGNMAAAEAAYRQAQADVAGAPPTGGVLRIRCGIHLVLSVLYKDTGRLPEAEIEAVAGVDGWRELVAAYPQTPAHRLKLAHAWSNLGNIRRYLGSEDGAVAASRESVTLCEQLLATNADNVEYRDALGRVLLNLGSMLVRGGDVAEGKDVLAQARTHVERLRRDDAKNAEYLRLLADILGETAFVQGEDGDYDAARENYQGAADAYAEALAGDPANLNYQDGRANMLRGVAEMLLSAGDALAALRTVDGALASLRSGLEKGPKHPARRRFARVALTVRVRACARLGEHDAAAASLHELVAVADGEGDSYEAARLGVQCAEDVGPGAHADAYAAATVAALRDAVARGHDASDLATDPRLEPLRHHALFKALRRELAQ